MLSDIIDREKKLSCQKILFQFFLVHVDLNGTLEGKIIKKKDKSPLIEGEINCAKPNLLISMFQATELIWCLKITNKTKFLSVQLGKTLVLTFLNFWVKNDFG